MRFVIYFRFVKYAAVTRISKNCKQLFISIQATQDKLLQKRLKRVYTVSNYSNDIIYQLLCCGKVVLPIFVSK